MAQSEWLVCDIWRLKSVQFNISYTILVNLEKEGAGFKSLLATLEVLMILYSVHPDNII